MMSSIINTIHILWKNEKDLYKKGFVSRAECTKDRRVRTVSLTEEGRRMFVPLFRRHTALIKRAFQDISGEELERIELVIKKIGKRAESLAEDQSKLEATHVRGRLPR
jgi:DNA-binding MarR family transcriptional regulator